MIDNEKQFESFVRGIKFDDTSDPGHRDKLEQDLLCALAKQEPRQIKVWRTIMKSKITKLATAAVIVLVIALSVSILDSSTTPAYAIEQTIEAFKNVQFMHIVRCDETGQVQDERWIEIGPDGIQARYRQDTPGRIFVVDNRENIFIYHRDKNTVLLYGQDGQRYTWIWNPGEWFEDLAGEGSIPIEENVDYWGRKAHRVRWLKLNLDCYIDPESKLPIAFDGYDISYEEPPEEIFDIPAIPEGVTFVDKRPGAETVEEPSWMNKDETAQSNFEEARQALAAGEYLKAVEFFKRVIEVQPRRNWAWFWLGRAYYELGEYDLAIYNFSKVLDMMGDQPYCRYARGLAFAAADMQAVAKKNLGKALPTMILALRQIEAAVLFDLADDPLRCADGFLDEGCHEGPGKEQSLAMMVNRLRTVTGQNFGYDPDAGAEEIERVISAWENWWTEDAADYGVTPR